MLQYICQWNITSLSLFKFSYAMKFYIRNGYHIILKQILQIEFSTLCHGISYSKTLSALVDISLLWNLFRTRRVLNCQGTQIQVHFHVLVFLLLLACWMQSLLQMSAKCNHIQSSMSFDSQNHNWKITPQKLSLPKTKIRVPSILE